MQLECVLCGDMYDRYYFGADITDYPKLQKVIKKVVGVKVNNICYNCWCALVYYLTEKGMSEVQAVKRVFEEEAVKKKEMK